MQNKILFINGPNLNLLGKRQPHLYGNQSLNEIESNLKKLLPPEYELKPLQSNHEGKIIDFLNDEFLAHTEKKINIAGIIINPGALTHTSIALRDALEVFALLNIKIYEVHLSNIFKREEFRHTSYISGIATGVVCGLGAFGYEAALQMLDLNKAKC